MCYNRAMKTNIILVGFMGAGKSLISRELAALTGREIITTDGMIEKAGGRSISDIFREDGEEHFRKLEKQAVASACAQEQVIIDCGGGVVLAPENIARLKETGVVFYLSATPEEIYRRVKDETHRPLLDTDDPMARIEGLLAQRRSFYEQADHIIDTNGRLPRDICQEILGLMGGTPSAQDMSA